MKREDITAFEALPAPETCRRIDFEKTEIIEGIVPGTYLLIVSGEKPWITMTVELQPLIYVDRPEYWGIEVIGCQSGPGLPASAPYTVGLNLAGVLGTKGIEVIGASGSKRIDVP